MNFGKPRRISDVIQSMNDVIGTKYPGVEFTDRQVRLVSQWTNSWVEYENVTTNQTCPRRPVMNNISFVTMVRTIFYLICMQIFVG